MQQDAEKILSALARRLGYADGASCKYLFIGIEEGGGPYDLDDFHLGTPAIELWTGRVSKARNQWSQIYTIISKIVALIEGITDLEAYQTTQMCHQGDVAGLMNLFPLPKKSIETWPYRSLTREQYQEWLFYHLPDRYAEIRQTRSAMPNLKATICFGRDFWQDFINCFNLSWDDYEEKEGVRVYKTRKFVFTPFFQYRYGTINDDEVIPRFVDAIETLEQLPAPSGEE
jgi:hypothetical protein